MSTVCVCCERPTSTGFLCRDGLQKTRERLRAVPGLVVALREAVARQVRFGGGAGGGSGVKPLPFNLDASEALRDLTSVLSTAAATVADRSGHPARYPTASGAAGYLLTRVSSFGSWAGSPGFYVELVDEIAASMKVIDTPMDLVYLGVCGAPTTDDGTCPAVVWGREGDGIAECARCETKHFPEPRLQALADKVRVDLDDRVMTVTDIAEALIAQGVMAGRPALLADKVRKLAAPRPPVLEGGPHREPLLAKRMDLQKPGQRRRAGYRVGDVIDLLTNTNRKTTKGDQS